MTLSNSHKTGFIFIKERKDTYMKIEELRQKVDEVKAEAKKLNEEARNKEDLAKANEKMEEFRNLSKQLDNAIELEKDEMRQLENQKKNEERQAKNNNEERGNNMGKVDEKRALVKHLLGKEMTEEERAVVKSTDVGSLIPKEYLTGIETYRDGFAPLKGDCDIIPVHSASGQKATHTAPKDKFKTIAEGDVIDEGSLSTDKMEYSVKKIGIKVPFTSEAEADAMEDIERLIRDDFAEMAVNTENASIINILNSNATAYDGGKTDYQAVEETLRELKPSLRAGAKVYVNEEAYKDFTTAKDKQGRSLNLVTKNQNGEEMFMGIAPLREFDSSMVDMSEQPNKKLIFVANTKEAVKFFDREEYYIKRWFDYDNDISKLSILERADIKAGNARSITKITLA